MNADEIRRHFQGLQIWSRQGKRAPNKPLLALWAIGRCMSGRERLATYEQVDDELSGLMRKFGRPGSDIRTHYPFWRLKNDGVWEVLSSTEIGLTSSKDPRISDLRTAKARGGFPEDLFDHLRHDPLLAEEIACSLVRAHFPATLRAEVLRAVGVERTGLVRRVRLERPRDPRFRVGVLAAYDFRCAVCGFAIRLGSASTIAVDAAHIKWHQACGPPDVQNGLALCSIHHRLFDYGAFTLLQNLNMKVSASAAGTGTRRWLMRFDGQPLSTIPDRRSRPGPAHIEWHQENVFRP